MKTKEIVKKSFADHDKIRDVVVQFFRELTREELLLIKRHKIEIDKAYGYKNKSSGSLRRMLIYILDVRLNRGNSSLKTCFLDGYISVRSRAPYQTTGWLEIPCSALDSKNGRKLFFEYLKQKVDEASAIEERRERAELKRLSDKYCTDKQPGDAK